MFGNARNLLRVDVRTECVNGLRETDVTQRAASVDLNSATCSVERRYPGENEIDRRPRQVGRKGCDTGLYRGNHALLQPHPLHELFLGIDQGNAEPEASSTEPKGGH